MATVGKLEYLQDELHALFAQDRETPAAGSPDWDLRTGFINRAIRNWENTPGVYWQQLWSTLAATSPGSPGRTVITGQVAYLAPSNFVYPGGFVWLLDANGLVAKKFNVIKPHKVQVYNEDTAAEFAYFTGNPNGGTTLTLNPVPTTAINGHTIVYNYYKRATELVAADDFIEMANPDFAIYHALSTLYQRQNDLPRAQNEFATAQDMLEGMEGRNNDDPPWQPAGADDLGAELGEGFGT